jgi:hypothetical protein
VAASAAAGRRSNTHPTINRFTASSAASPIAHNGKPLRGGATLTSKSAGPFCRWRSVSDFFSASRMNDIGHPP